MPKPQPARKPKPQPTSKRSAPRPSRPAKPPRQVVPTIARAAAKQTSLLDLGLLPDPATSPTLCRAKGLNTEAVERYAEVYAAGGAMPAIIVYHDEKHDQMHFGDGHHRAAGARVAKITEIEAEVRRGTLFDALLFASGCNDTHGLPRTNADKRLVVGNLLKNDQLRKKSDRALCEIAHVSARFVGLVRKELGAISTTIERKDGSTQKQRNAAATGPRQQTLDDAACADERAAVERFWPRLEKLGLPTSKLRILAALYLYGAGASMPRAVLQNHTQRPLDVHPGQLRKMGWIHGDNGAGYELDESHRETIAALIEASGAETESGLPQTAPPAPTPIAPAPTAAAAPTGPEEVSLDQVAEPEAAGASEDLVASQPAAHGSQPSPAPAADEPAPQQVKPLELRRVDRQREILQHRLMTGKPQWQGTDSDLLLLGLICGVPTRTVAWIDACRARARDLFIDALRTEVADRIRTGVAINARIWPQLADLCRLWGLDWQAIEIEAERAVPE